MSEATGRPWTIRHDYNIYGGEDRLAANTGGHGDNRDPVGNDEENKANAAIIVRCVNSHDALVKALKDATERLDGLLNVNIPGGDDGHLLVDLAHPAVEAAHAAIENGRAALALARGDGT